ncbi:imidazole glycerol phosphate synthase subunit HisH [Vicingus serpentipes]|uniref:Imidazole glycerol phosphate synthase subunit HisH n=1 Tax=Vicingus serpentipes TaxID=1926625 RepID=A0A5C6RYP1_9FLAO|nr:imidazole glycerol phosphate synthase subunit HisH [Vicingus serpentipes]TXB67273.1 imidazole glycerol phosphate synthase subunit HisH [Vicingus serpentipes]
MIVIIDYKMGNLLSVKKKINQLSSNVIVSSDITVIKSADKIILPGVGHFGKAMENLKKLNLINILNNLVIEEKKPVLGICLGMQIMTKKSEEGNVQGLDWIDAEVIKFKVNDTLKFKVPHTGWNQIISNKDSRLMVGIPDGSEFYFVHSYHVKTNNTNITLNTTVYEHEFISAFQQENIFGVQYHPEKSHDVGVQLLKNFIAL